MSTTGIYELVEVVGDAVVVAPTRRSTATPPAVGTRLRCRSSAGYWEATVARHGDDHLVLTLPAWTRRPTQRSSVRVPLDLVPVELTVRGRPWAGRLVDLSVGGAGVIVEDRHELHVGARVQVRLPDTNPAATIVNRRAHDHRLLRVLGLAWASSGAGSGWARDQISRARHA